MDSNANNKKGNENSQNVFLFLSDMLKNLDPETNVMLEFTSRDFSEIQRFADENAIYPADLNDLVEKEFLKREGKISDEEKTATIVYFLRSIYTFENFVDYYLSELIKYPRESRMHTEYYISLVSYIHGMEDSFKRIKKLFPEYSQKTLFISSDFADFEIDIFNYEDAEKIIARYKQDMYYIAEFPKSYPELIFLDLEIEEALKNEDYYLADSLTKRKKSLIKSVCNFTFENDENLNDEK